MSGISFELALRRASFRRGERFDVEVAVHNRGTETLALHDPADAASDQIVYTLAGGVDRILVGSGSLRPTRPIEPECSLRADVPLSDWVDLGPGDYTLSARLAPQASPDGAPVASNTVAFRVFEPDHVQVVLSAGRFDELPPAMVVRVAALGARDAVLFEHPLVPHAEHRGQYELAPPYARFTPSRPPLQLLPVAASPGDRLGWLVWTDEHGLVARAGDATVEGVAELALEAPVLPVGPVLQHADGAALAYVISGPTRELVECRFDPPRSSVQEPEGPDDWDDEVWLAGAAKSQVLGTLPFIPSGGGVFRDAERTRVVFLEGAGGDPEIDGGDLIVWHANLGGSGLEHWTFALFQDAIGLVDAVPLITADARGDTAVHVLFGRKVAPTPPADEGHAPLPTEVFIGSASFGREGTSTSPASERSLGHVAAPVRSAVAAHSWLAHEGESFKVVILDGLGSVHLADDQTPLRRVRLDAPPVVPLTLGCTSEHAYLCIETANGPLPSAL